MDVNHILESLNTPQRDAVSSPDQNCLIVAGAGSGKTRVLTHRIAWLVDVCSISPYEIFAVTFTNKAAGEMRGRVESMLGVSPKGMWIGTFHGLAHRLLRQHWEQAGLPQQFRILDSDDQYRLIRRVMQNLNLEESQYSPRQIQWFINDHKDRGQRWDSIHHGDNPEKMVWIDIFRHYDEQCILSGLVDFAELLLRVHELWLNNPDILDHYQNRFRYLLIDEFQDTNDIQYAWIRLLAGSTGIVFAVGDDDQSIYGWRGANVANIRDFTRHFNNTKTVRLEQNYRSSANILNVANGLIKHNPDRLGKNLWTDDPDGEPVQEYAAFNEQDEAHFVIQRIKEWIDDGNLASQAAILYRSNAQSRQFEEFLLMSNISYQVYGGLRFFERAEIKDALAYLRLANNFNDDTAFERIVNTPSRGIGLKTLEKIRKQASSQQKSLWQCCVILVKNSLFSKRAGESVSAFLQQIEAMSEKILHQTLSEQVFRVIEASKLIAHYEKEGVERAQARQENLDELITAADGFRIAEEDSAAGMTDLDSFLSRAALDAGESQAKDPLNSVQLMTLHSAKGLEFSMVFIAGMEEGLFPHKRSMNDPARLEEERRLCYVGITRAREILYVCHAESRRIYGSSNQCKPSRFINELPRQYIREIRPRISSRPRVTSSLANTEPDQCPFQLGSSVRHPNFGDGVVLNVEGSGPHTRVHVNFEYEGAKWMVLSFAKLSRI